MKPRSAGRDNQRGFTLVEVIIATGVTAMMFAAVLSTSVSLYRSFTASDEYSSAKSNQLRAIDYIVRDLRGALTVTLNGNSQKLTLTLPDYYTSYDSRGNPGGLPVAPAFTGTTVDYGDAAKPITISYFVEGQSLMREVKIGRTGNTSRNVIGTGVNDFAMSFGQLDSVVNVSITFSTSFKGASRTAAEGTKLSAAVSVRNVRRN